MINSLEEGFDILRSSLEEYGFVSVNGERISDIQLLSIAICFSSAFGSLSYALNDILISAPVIMETVVEDTRSAGVILSSEKKVGGFN